MMSIQRKTPPGYTRVKTLLFQFLYIDLSRSLKEILIIRIDYEG